MKTKFIKMVLSVFMLMLAIFGAFAFKSAENKALLALENGWINLPGQPCAIQVQCDNTPSANVCTAIYNGVQYQAFGKVHPQFMICDKVLFRPW